MSRAGANWNPLTVFNVPNEVQAELRKEHPDLELLRDWRISEFTRQTGISLEGDSEHARNEFIRWARFQQDRAEVDLEYRRWPRLEHLLFDTYTDKVSSLAQRHCLICAGARPIEQLFPVSLIPIRLAPRSRQVMNRSVWSAFQAALAYRFSRSPPIDLGVTGRLCIAITFILSDSGRDKDLDNMVKALQDGLARAVGFNDAYVHHLDVLKLVFPTTEEYMIIRIAPSALNEHDEVCVHSENHSWAGAPVLEIEDFLP